LGEAVIAEFLRGFPEDYDFGMGGWIAIADGAVAATREDLPSIDEHCADGDFARFGTGSGLVERQLHEIKIVHRFVHENITLYASVGWVVSLQVRLRQESLTSAHWQKRLWI
jgi:hypothetical protein